MARLQVITTLVIVTVAVIFIILERRYPYNSGYRTLRKGFWTDLIGYGFIQSYIMGIVISSLIFWVDGMAGFSRFKVVSHWPIWVQVIFFIITHDLATYLIHRAQHRSKYLWRLHEAHHGSPQVDWVAGLRSHSLEILLYQTVEFAPVFWLGAAPEVPLYKAMADAFYGMYIHANVSFKMGPLLWVFNGPELHRWHHANDDKAAFGKNLSTKFTVWDRWFGTLYIPKGKSQEYGPGPDFPESYLGQHWYAFRLFPKKASV